eukprot:2788910-Heterocapsa_arctica.AAC.1
MRVGMVLFDRGTKFTKLYASARETARACEDSPRHCHGHLLRDKSKILHTDGAPELIKAGRAMKCQHDTSTPNRSATN